MSRETPEEGLTRLGWDARVYPPINLNKGDLRSRWREWVNRPEFTPEKQLDVATSLAEVYEKVTPWPEPLLEGEAERLRAAYRNFYKKEP